MSAEESLSLLTRQLRASLSTGPDSQKPVFWLGAGCSLFDGVPLTNDLLAQVLGDDADGWGSPQFRFDQLCDALNDPRARAGLLAPYMKRDIKPDSPYHALREILVAGYADVVFTFNIDSLLEQALVQGGLREHDEYTVIDVAQLQPSAVLARLGSQHGGPRIRLVKLHGGYEYGLNNMTSSEIVGYGEKIRPVVEDWSSRPAVVCGYSFFHLNVLEAFSRRGGPLYYANPEFPNAPMILSLMAVRSQGRHSPLFIDGELGTFVRLMDELRRGLLGGNKR